MPLTVEIITVERVVRVEQNIDVVIAPGSEGQLAILPKHAALMTTLDPGMLVFRRAGVEEDFSISGGFMEVLHNRVTILADAAEAAEEIDLQRAEAARQRAEQRLRSQGPGSHDVDMARARASLQRSLMRIRVAERGRRRGTDGRPRV
jgi:F-type H+-transporting ATPase subunit epsilon